jgi:hypothetical protein
MRMSQTLRGSGKPNWTQFVDALGVGGDELILDNHKRLLLEICNANICGLTIEVDKPRTPDPSKTPPYQRLADEAKTLWWD